MFSRTVLKKLTSTKLFVTHQTDFTDYQAFNVSFYSTVFVCQEFLLGTVVKIDCRNQPTLSFVTYSVKKVSVHTGSHVSG